jgi:hypothetical protein
MLTTLLPPTAKFEDLFDAWDAAARDARLAWDTWRSSAGRDRVDARACYAASLDREECAAQMLATAMRSRHRPILGSRFPVAV